MKFSASGCFTDSDNISAPRRPSCATSRVEFEYRSMNGTIPVEVSALFSTGLPVGRMCDRSCPTPPRRFISCTCSSSMRMMPPYESAGWRCPITKQFDSDAICRLLPMPVIGPPCGIR